MSVVGELETLAQQRVVRFFQDELGYTYLGDWINRPDNSNVKKEILANWLKRQGHNDKLTDKALQQLEKAVAIGGSRTLYDANKEVYGLLRYGVKVLPEVGEQHLTVWLIDWNNPANNEFVIAEEVTVIGKNTKRPDIVLYVNGIALCVLELKRSTVSVAEGIRQNLDNQKKEFIRPFFSTVQLIMAGNETEGLRYAMIETPEKYWLRWKEAASDVNAGDNSLLRETGQLCNKERLLEIIHDFISFDAGIKKICRHNQYFGVRAAQEHVQRREGGIIWHTQGSGKSLTMVWLAKWIRENIADAQVLLITDRTELDEQIEETFLGVNEHIYRTTSGADLVDVLNTRDKWLSCSLIQKFGAAEEGDIDTFIGDIRSHLPQDFYPKGELFVFVDECHRTQSGKLHDAMKELLPAAVLIGFTGTPLLKDDKKRSIETFGPYIHTYKYDQAVNDDVVLDLRYEARDIDQDIVAPDKIDEWFELKTKALTDAAKAQLRQRWGTMQKVLSSQDRLQKIVADILLDMERCDRLKSGRGNALLVSGSIYSACRIFEMFQQHGMGKKCAIVTSYRPSPSDIKGEETGEGLTEKLRQHEIYRKMLAAHFNEPEETAIHKVQKFEKNVKRRFVKEPGQMKLLIVVDKLLTGFDAPPATYLYIDKHMQEHGLFQAICRVNRLDGEDKEYGYIIDYKDLFRSLEQSIKDYTGEAFAGYDRDDVEGLLKDRLEQGRKRLEQTREAIKALCEPVNRPCDTADYLRYFCVTDNADVEQLKANEPKRAALYKSAAAYLRAYANLANEMIEAGYNDTEIRTIKAEVDHYEKACREVKLASGDYIDMKLYEPAMRHLLDTYIRAEDSKQLSILDDMTLVELIVERGESAVDSLPDGIRNDHEAVAATVENNLRRLIVDEMAVNPKYYTEMSKLLDALILQRKQEALDYKAYLVKIVELTRNTTQPKKTRYPYTINNPGRRALYDNLKEHAHDLEEHILKNKAADTAADAVETATLALDDAIRSVKKADWRGNRFKEREVRNAIKSVLGDREDLVDEFFEIVKAQYDY
ncbi:MAG: HsdR family type I site-specific deoxyribonuclease [Gammaproteobacteria bacterium]|nr:HsdR family type I site-specific deoxyribonuclease [Gammaproteobacteria bacterium]MCY4338503.1 HsdR family type I site-specific deoxyribonuclease [Gammaproteobacteria bacterium]